ncbi:MAG: hypothetical protein U0Y10_08705 [Spirosomataceae bacterium]
MKTAYCTLLLLATLVACNQPSKPKTDAPITQQNDVKIVPIFTFKEVKKQPDDGLPHVEVSLQLGEKTIRVADVNACETIQQENYAQYEIPSEALAACGGWYAGAGDYFYITENATHWLVMQGWQDEQQADKGYHYSQKISVAKK